MTSDLKRTTSNQVNFYNPLAITLSTIYLFPISSPTRSKSTQESTFHIKSPILNTLPALPIYLCMTRGRLILPFEKLDQFDYLS